jgi:phage baseplate assembly protein W
MTNIAHPFRLDGRGHVASSNDEDHVRELIEQVLFTSPGERVNRPSFGCGLLQLIFAPNSDELASTVQYLAEASLQQWLGDLIEVKSVTAAAEDSTLRVVIEYVLRRNQEQRTAEVSRSIPT